MGIKIFAATRPKEIEELGSVVTSWIRNHPEVIVQRTEVYQTLRVPYQCLTIVLSYIEVKTQYQYKQEINNV